MRKHETLIISLLLYLLCLGLLLNTSLREIVYDGDELRNVQDIIANGWHFTETHNQNVSSLVIGFIAPSLARIFHIDPAWLFKLVFPAIFALSPVLLFYLYRQQLHSSWMAICAVIFFILLPPTFQQVPAIAKSMIAEPLAILTLVVWFSQWRYRIVATTGLVLLTLLAHYTIGFFLIGWLGIIAMSKLKLSNLIPATVGGAFAALYFNFASNGAVWAFITRFSEFHTKDFNTLFRLKVTYDNGALLVNIAWDKYMLLFLVIIFVGGGYLVSHWRQFPNKELGVCIIAMAILVVAAYFIPVLTYVLFLSRWIQISSIVLCPLLPLALKWLELRPLMPERQPRHEADR